MYRKSNVIIKMFASKVYLITDIYVKSFMLTQFIVFLPHVYFIT